MTYVKTYLPMLKTHVVNLNRDAKDLSRDLQRLEVRGKLGSKTLYWALVPHTHVMIYGHYTRVLDNAGLPLFHFFTAVQRHHLLRNALICLAKFNSSQVAIFVLPNIKREPINREALGGWFSDPRRCIALSILQTASLNCFLPMSKKKKHKKRNNFLVRQRNVNEII